MNFVQFLQCKIFEDNLSARVRLQREWREKFQYGFFLLVKVNFRLVSFTDITSKVTLKNSF